MKKIILLLTIVMAVVADAMAQNDAVYVYRNDGGFNAFFKNEIDSMVYTHYDADSKYHSEWIAQLVYTTDSVYYIPLDVIDSVSFVAPETKYSSDVVKMDELIPYLKGVDGLSLSFIDSTPSYLMPRVGDVLLYEHFDNTLLPQGFAGKVSTIDSNVIVCDSVNLSDVYDQLICFGEYTAIEEEQPQSGLAKVRLVPKKSTSGISSSIGLKGTVGSLNSLYLSVDGSLNFDVRVISKITATASPYVDVSVTPAFTASLTGGVKGKFSGNLLQNKVKVFGMPIPDTPFYVYISSGPVVEPSLEASVNVTTDVKFGFRLGIRYQNNTWSPYGENVSKGFSTPEITGSINGSVFTGIATDVGISSYGDIMKFYIEKKLGVELSANIKEDMLNSDKYEELSKAKVDLNFVGSISANAALKFTKWIKASGGFNLFSTKVGINSWKLLPSFSTPEVTDTKPTSAKVTVTPSEDLLQPVSIGIGLMDKNNNLQECQYVSSTYRLEKDSKAGQYNYQFNKLKSDEEYKACPMVKWNGIDIKATPQKSFTLNSVKVNITSFKVTKSSYSKGAYYNDGRTYDYKFDAATTVKIESTDGVSDWGYVYKDPYGNAKRISLMSYGTSYTDTHYAYYRNVAKSTACLYPYVKYEGDTEYYYGDEKEYDLIYEEQPLCPDDHHPHAIDLGLPSGTKWCCMNVGATAPEGYGGYYAWGETSEKSVYDWDTYAYYNSSTDECINIGSDIAGTSYDAAHVNMGGSWVMPSHTQQQELVNNCSREWTQQNGVNGILVTGPNGGKIFLPAAGIRWDDCLYYAGSLGSCWSSSLGPGSYYCAYYLCFDSGRWYWDSYGRGNGQSVRAVCPQPRI